MTAAEEARAVAAQPDETELWAVFGDGGLCEPTGEGRRWEEEQGFNVQHPSLYEKPLRHAGGPGALLEPAGLFRDYEDSPDKARLVS